MFNTLCCLTSSYFYVVLAAFPTMLENEMLINLNLGYEVIFTVTIMLSFFAEYVEEGNPEPIRDLATISLHYLKT